MESREKHTPGKYRGTKITSGVVISAVTVLILVLFLLLLMKLAILPTPSFLQTVLGTGSVSEQTGEVRKSAIPDFSADAAAEEESYYTFPLDARELLAELTEPESYVREFRVINSYGGEADIQKYTLTVDGSRYRLESDFKNVICDGTTIATVTETYRTILNGTVFTAENEIGITPLSEVKAAAEKGSVTYSRRQSEDKTLLVVAEDAETGILAEYAVSIETGLVVTERSYIHGEMYRAVVTDALDIFAANDLPEEYFKIPGTP